MNIPYTHIEVLSYFKEGGSVVGREICDSLAQARTFAAHQLKMFPYVEVVSVSGYLTDWGDQVKSKEVIYRFW